MANGNGTVWKIVLGLAIPALILAATWGATKLQVNNIKTEKLPAIEAVNKEQSEDIDVNENAIIRIEGSIESLSMQQETYHKDSDRKLDAILEEVRK